MISFDRPESVRRQLDDSVAGLTARKDMRAAILAAETDGRKRQTRSVMRLAPALAAALVVAMVGFFGFMQNRAPAVNELYAIEAGSGVAVTARPIQDHEFVLNEIEEDHAILILGGNLYRMTRFLDGGARLAGNTTASVTVYSENPYDYSRSQDVISNAVLPGDPVYTVQNLPASTAVIAEVDGQLALFQRSGEHGFGLNGDSLENTVSVRGQVASLTLEGVGTLTGEKAEAAMDALLENARLESTDALPGDQRLTISLTSGVQLELTVSGDQLIGCGVWDCTEFLDLFRELVASSTNPAA